jgi:flagellin-like protein
MSEGFRDTKRGVAPVISTVLLVAVVVVLGTTVSIFALGLGESTTTSPPTTALETVGQAENDTIVLRHRAGDTIERADLRVRGANNVTAPETITAGETIAVEPADNASELAIVWETTEESALLTSVPVADGASTQSEPIIYTQPATSNLTAQCQEGTITETNLSDPFTVEVVLNESVDENVSLDISARDSLGACGTPTNTYGGATEPSFSDGVGQFTIGTVAGDLSFEPFFPGVEVNDVDAIAVTAVDGHYEVDEIRIIP